MWSDVDKVNRNPADQGSCAPLLISLTVKKEKVGQESKSDRELIIKGEYGEIILANNYDCTTCPTSFGESGS